MQLLERKVDAAEELESSEHQDIDDVDDVLPTYLEPANQITDDQPNQQEVSNSTAFAAGEAGQHSSNDNYRWRKREPAAVSAEFTGDSSTMEPVKHPYEYRVLQISL